MPSQTKCPQTITQVTGDSTKTSWTNLNNLKTNNTNYASTQAITGVKGKHPKTRVLQLTNFGFNLPEGAEVTSITVRYNYRKRAKTTNKYPSIAGPVIMLKNSLPEQFRYANDGAAPPKEFPTKNWTRTWNGKYTQEVIVPGSTASTTSTSVGNVTVLETKTKTITQTYDLPSRATINSTKFGVEFAFPKNTSQNEGYIDFKLVEITVNYKIPTYLLSLQRVDNEEIVKDIPVTVNAILNNKDLTRYAPTLHLSTPTDMELEITNINLGSFTKLSDGLYEWKPFINKTIGSVTLELRLTPHTSGANTIRLEELLTEAAANITLDVQQQSTSIHDEEIPAEQALYAVQNQQFKIPIKVPLSLLETVTTVYLHTDKAITVNNTNVAANGRYPISVSSFDENGEIVLTATTAVTGTINLGVSLTTTKPDTPTFILKVTPASITVPRLVIFPLSGEALNRLGHGINYEISSFLQIVCNASFISLFEDYYRNFRLGVVNSIESTDKEEIFKECRNWCSGLSSFNEFERKEVTFTYNENYPVYILISGDFDTEYDGIFNIQFTEFEVMEEDRDDAPRQVVFPEPIRDILTIDDGYSSILEIPRYLTSNSLIAYDFELPEAFQDNPNLAIRGIGVKVNASALEPVMLSAKLTSNGQTGERSSIISNLNNTWTLGGTNDRWGFSISELRDITNFNIELSFSNISVESEGSVEVDIENIELVLYYNFFENSLVECLIDGENLSSYNVFLTDVEIPAGLETDTKYLTVDGTDTNDGYRQNIKEKEITLEFDIDECTIDEATATLNEVAELLVNERDSLNNPIEKRIEFTHYPNIYWEYIMEKAIDVSSNAGSYSCKVKLTIPAGTAFTNEEISTGRAGTVQGLAKINPVIMVTPTAEHIELEESVTGQKFMMSYNSWFASDVIEIDCEERTVTLHRGDEEIDITAYTDFNSNWFILHRNFLFNETNCIIQSVTWTERR